MPAEYDLIIRRAQLRGKPGSLVDIGVQGGKVAAIAEKMDADARLEINADGNLVTESFVNPHLHLCKVYTLQRMDEEALKDYHAEGMGKAMTAIELAARVNRRAVPPPPDWVGLEGSGDLRFGDPFGWQGLLDFLQRLEHLLHLARQMGLELWAVPNE